MSVSPSQDSMILLLKQVQVKDKEIFDLTQMLSEFPAEIQELEESFEAEKAKWKSLSEEAKQLQVKQKDLETELGSQEGQVTKYDAQLTQVKTNKEYSALQLEINSLKAGISMVEEKIIGIMDQVEQKKAEAKVEEVRLKKEEAALAERKQEVEKRRKEALDRINALSSERKEILTHVDKKVAGNYEAILKKRDGLALAPMTDESCGVCQMAIRPQVQNDVRLARQMVTCENCGRILYSEEEAPSS